MRGWTRDTQVLLSSQWAQSSQRVNILQLQMADKSGGSTEEGKVSSNVARVSPVAMVAPTSPTADTNSKLSPPPSYKVAVYEAQKVEQESPSRETWDKKIEFLLAVVGFAVDLGNVSRNYRSPKYRSHKYEISIYSGLEISLRMLCKWRRSLPSSLLYYADIWRTAPLLHGALSGPVPQVATDQ